MKTNLYVIEDTKAESQGPIFEAVNHAVAIRGVQQMKISTPEDFILLHIADRDMSEITTHKPVKIDWVKKDLEVLK